MRTTDDNKEMLVEKLIGSSVVVLMPLAYECCGDFEF